MINSNERNSISSLLRRLWRHMSKKRHRQLAMLLVLMFFSSVAEILSIGAVIPFLGILSSPEQVFYSEAIQPIIKFFDFKSPKDLVWPITICFILATLFAGMIRLILVFVNTRLSFATGHDLSIDIYNKTLFQPFHIHIDRNSSEIVNGVATKTDLVIFQIILPFLNVLSSLVMISLITIAIVVLNPFIALSIMGGLGLIYYLLIRLTSLKLLQNSEKIADKSTIRIKALQEGLGGIRDILLSATQETYYKIYKNADLPLRRSQATNAFISLSPRYAMEAIGMILIALVAFYFTSKEGSVESIIPILGGLALAAQRMLPMLQMAYQGWSSILGGQGSLVDVLELLDQQIIEETNEIGVDFNRNIILENISFRYKNDQLNVLDNINIEIRKGTRVGFIGTTGSGKSTLLDIVMGLLTPTSGKLIIDGKELLSNNLRSWQDRISHVPQDIFLSDSTIKENIAFGIPFDEIKIDKVFRAASLAQLDTVIEALPDKYNTLVGERGVRLSGGQKQRIGIARALYAGARLMIFDEATSALDGDTEKEVMKSIEMLDSDLTILIIAHRITTLQGCDQIIELQDGKIIRFGDYKSILKRKKF